MSEGCSIITKRETVQSFIWAIEDLKFCDNELAPLILWSPEFFTINNLIMQKLVIYAPSPTYTILKSQLFSKSTMSELKIPIAGLHINILDDKKSVLSMIKLEKDKVYLNIFKTSHITRNSKLNFFVQINLTRDKTYDLYSENKMLCVVENMLWKEEFSDVTFNVCGKEVFAHKIILASHSPVFKEMFTHNVEEKKENLLQIVDVKLEVFKELLRFMYIGEVKDIEKLADDLLIAAETYSLGKLKTLCEKIIGRNLTTENVVKYLNFAHKHNALHLQKEAIIFIQSNLSEIYKKPQFELIGKLHPDLMFTVLRSIIEKYVKEN